LWLTQEGLLTGNDAADANLVYFRANVIERTIDSAKAFAAGLLPAAGVTVDYYGRRLATRCSTRWAPAWRC